MWQRSQSEIQDLYMKESMMNATDPIVITSSASESYGSNSDIER